jgi:phosphatidylglycerophosphatase C
VFLRREPLHELAAYAQEFCSGWLCRRLRPPVLALLRQHQAAGHRVVLVSASPDLYVPQVAEYLGIFEWVCTCVSVENGICTGILAGPNCKGWYKVQLLQRHLGTATPPDLSYAYGDSPSDLPLLSWVRYGALIKRGKPVAL